MGPVWILPLYKIRTPVKVGFAASTAAALKGPSGLYAQRDAAQNNQLAWEVSSQLLGAVTADSSSKSYSAHLDQHIQTACDRLAMAQ